MSWAAIVRCVGSFVHWLTGWIAHPDKGGCCSTTPTDYVNDLKNQKSEVYYVPICVFNL